MIGYLQSNKRPDISMESYQCSYVVANPKFSHKRAVKWISQYIRQPKHRGLIIKHKPLKGNECFVIS